MAYRLVIELPGAPELPNAIGRKHWSFKSKHTRFWRGMVAVSVGCQKPSEPLQRARVRIDVWRKRVVDPDGLVTSCKPILDGLQPPHEWKRGVKRFRDAGASVLTNDKPDNFEGGRAEIIGHRCKKDEHPHVVVTVEEVES